jgi:hypothetical protein
MSFGTKEWGGMDVAKRVEKSELGGEKKTGLKRNEQRVASILNHRLHCDPQMEKKKKI